MEPNYEQTVSLEEAMTVEPTYGRQLKTFVAFNTGYRTFTTSLTLFELQEMTEVANEQSKLSTAVAQRKLDPAHASAIAKYILKGLLSAAKRKKGKQGIKLSFAFEEVQRNLGMQPYLSIPPLVASLRNCQPNGTDLKVIPMSSGMNSETACYKIFLKPNDTLWIVDGQHRRMGLHMAFDFLKAVATTHRYPSRASLYPGDSKQDMAPDELSVWTDCFEMLREINVAVEVHLGLNIDQERQLFHDLNNLSKRVDKSLALNYDGSNPINSFIGEVILDELFVDFGFPQINEKDKLDWSARGLTRQELVAINALLFLNKTNINGAVPAIVDPKLDTAREFWEMVLNLNGFTHEQSKQQTVASQPVVLKALAKLMYDFTFGKNKEWVNAENQSKLIEGIKAFDFGHTNPLWRYYEMGSDEKEQFLGLADYLPSEDEGYNRDIGMFDNHTQVFRFGSKHNDIYPIIGDMVRWSLSLPPRKRTIEAESL